MFSKILSASIALLSIAQSARAQTLSTIVTTSTNAYCQSSLLSLTAVVYVGTPAGGNGLQCLCASSASAVPSTGAACSAAQSCTQTSFPQGGVAPTASCSSCSGLNCVTNLLTSLATTTIDACLTGQVLGIVTVNGNKQCGCVDAANPEAGATVCANVANAVNLCTVATVQNAAQAISGTPACNFNCGTGFVLNSAGTGCVLAASQRARTRRTKLPNTF